jgi:hypothetical protein
MPTHDDPFDPDEECNAGGCPSKSVTMISTGDRYPKSRLLDGALPAGCPCKSPRNVKPALAPNLVLKRGISNGRELRSLRRVLT